MKFLPLFPTARRFSLVLLLAVTTLLAPLAAAQSDLTLYNFWLPTATVDHTMYLVDDNDQVIPLATPYAYIAREYVDPNSGQVQWLPDWGVMGSGVATGAWRYDSSAFCFGYLPAGLLLTEQYYLYDATAQVYSEPLWRAEGLVHINPEVQIPGAGVEEPPVKVFGRSIFVLGGALVRGRARFDGPVRIAPAGDLSMGAFTQEPPQ